MKAPDKLERWQCLDMTREQLIEELLLRDRLISLERKSTPAEIHKAYDEGAEEGYKEGYADAKREVRDKLLAVREKDLAAFVRKMQEVRQGVDELHRTDTPGPARRVVDHLYWLLNFA